MAYWYKKYIVAVDRGIKLSYSYIKVDGKNFSSFLQDVMEIATNRKDLYTLMSKASNIKGKVKNVDEVLEAASKFPDINGVIIIIGQRCFAGYYKNNDIKLIERDFIEYNEPVGGFKMLLKGVRI